MSCFSSSELLNSIGPFDARFCSNRWLRFFGLRGVRDSCRARSDFALRKYWAKSGSLKSPSQPPHSGRKGRANAHTFNCKFRKHAAPIRLAAGKREVHLYGRFDLDRLAVQQVWLVLPLLYSFDRCWSQHRVTADQLQILNVAVLADLRLQHYRTLNARLTSERRIRGLDLADQKPGLHARRYTHTLWSGDLGQGHVRARAGNAAEHAAHGASRDTARNSAQYACRRHNRRRRLFFLNHLDFLWNLGRSAQLAVHDVGLDHLYDLDRRSGWRWRRWRRRGGHQET